MGTRRSARARRPGLLWDARPACSMALLALIAVGAGAGEIALPVPDPIAALPTVRSERGVVHAPSGWGDLTYHHRPVITAWRGKLYVAWHAAKRSERTPPVVGLVASSADGRTWSTPARFAEPGDAAYVRYTRGRHRLGGDRAVSANTMPRTFHAAADRLYLFASAWGECRGKRYWRGRAFVAESGGDWSEMPPAQLDRQAGLLIRNHWGNGRLLRRPDGRLMAACSGRDGLCAPATTDPAGLSQWTGGCVDVGDCPVRVDPQVWRGPDGVLHYAAGHLSRLWHAHSSDAGRTWSKLAEQPQFPDNRGGAAFGELPDGRA